MEEPIEYTDFKFEEITYRTKLTRKFAERKPYTPMNPKKVTAFIPGTIMKVLVKEGQKVKKGEYLLVLQAMKMDNHLLALMNGTIKKIHVKQGDTVPKNQLLVEFK
jgi:biotin carboxyl carrier protein